MNELAGFVSAAFGFEPGTMTRGNRGALGQIWRLRTPTKVYAVKQLFSARAPDERRIAAEAAYTDVAAAAGVRVPRSHPARDGRYAIRLPVGGWIRVFDWLDLTPVEPTDLGVSAQLGALLARLHRAAPRSTAEPDGSPPDPWFAVPPVAGIWPSHVDAALQAGATWAADLAAHTDRIVRITGVVTPADPAAMVTCHRDLHPENVLLNGGELAVVDWDNLGPAEPTRELAKVLFDWYFGDDVWHEAATRRMLDAYREHGGPGRLTSIADFGLLTAARLNFLDRQVRIALDPQADAEHRAWAVKEIDEALTILPATDAFEAVLQLAS